MFYYRYEPLQYNDSIRVLVLHPNLSSSDPITCTIQHARLSNASLKYEAVSYTWGSATQTQTIYLHDSTRELFIKQNCYSALRHLRRKHEDRLLWIDAICINQNDLEERACQVRIMDRVFSYASNVMVFLEETIPSNCILFEELAAANEVLLRTGRCERSPPSDAILQELEELFRNPWFKRVWVLQEVCAKSSVNFMCGSASFSFSSLVQLYVGYRGTTVTKEYWPQVLDWINCPPDDFSTPEFNLWNRLHESRYCLATDPKDRVFALQSLTGSRQSEMDFLINYAQSVEECFIQVATFLLPVLGLRILTAIRHPHERDMPSWIPDWSQDLPLHFYYFVIESIEEKVGLPAPIKPYDDQKHKIRPSSVGKSGNGLELLITGCQYARIDESSQVFMFQDNEDVKEQMKELFSCLGCLTTAVSVGGIQNDHKMADRLGKQIFDALSSISGDKLYLHLSRWLCFSRLSEEIPIDREDARFFFESLHRCRISLMDNKELAIVPAGVKSGDMVCILSETDAPCVLRADQNDNWTLVSGDCYIFAESISVQSHGWFPCNEYILEHDQQVQDFIIR